MAYATIKIDTNAVDFLESFAVLEKADQRAVLKTLRKIRQLDWPAFYKDQGLKWEKIHSVRPPQGIESLYSLRITQALRAVAYRDDDFLRILLIAPDHDKAYGKK